MRDSFKKTFEIAQTMLIGMRMIIKEERKYTPEQLKEYKKKVPDSIYEHLKYTHSVVYLDKKDEIEAFSFTMKQTEGLHPFISRLAQLAKTTLHMDGVIEGMDMRDSITKSIVNENSQLRLICQIDARVRQLEK